MLFMITIIRHVPPITSASQKTYCNTKELQPIAISMAGSVGATLSRPITGPVVEKTAGAIRTGVAFMQWIATMPCRAFRTISSYLALTSADRALASLASPVFSDCFSAWAPRTP